MNWIMRTLTPHDVKAPRGEAQLAWLGRKYGTTAQRIAQANSVPWRSSSVNAWVLERGGKVLESGGHVFRVGNQIMLPDKAVIEDPSPPAPPQAAAVKSGGVPWWGWLGLGGLGILIVRRIRRPKKGN